MKFFETCLRYAAAVGARKLQPGETSQFNCRNIGVLFVFSILFASVSGYIWFDANSIYDYTVSLFFCFSLFSLWIGFVIMTVKTPDIYEVIEHGEKVVETRK